MLFIIPDSPGYLLNPGELVAVKAAQQLFSFKAVCKLVLLMTGNACADYEDSTVCFYSV